MLYEVITKMAYPRCVIVPVGFEIFSQVLRGRPFASFIFITDEYPIVKRQFTGKCQHFAIARYHRIHFVKARIQTIAHALSYNFV